MVFCIRINVYQIWIKLKISMRTRIQIKFNADGSKLKFFTEPAIKL